MKAIFRIFATMTLGAVLLSAQSMNQPGRAAGTPPQPNAAVNALAQSSLIRILTPVAGQSTTANAVQLKFQLINPTASSSGSPNYQLQIDGADPVTTTSTEYTFTGLAPGSHSITVVLVDANGTPTMGGRATVQFAVKSPVANPRGSLVRPAQSSLALLEPREMNDEMTLHEKLQADSLPMLSVIGFGVLIGGVASAIKTRR
jgi:hypothetical protein